MPKYTIEYDEQDKARVLKYLKEAEGKMKIVLIIYMDIGVKDIGNNQFEFRFEPRKAFSALLTAGGASAESAMFAMGTEGMMKLNERFKKEKIKARVINLT